MHGTMNLKCRSVVQKYNKLYIVVSFWVIIDLNIVLVHVMTAYEGRRSITPLILNLGTRWRQVVYFKFRSLYPIERTAVLIELEAG
jgi:hypothetical protein